MPELPEVEVTRRHLHDWLVGGSVVRAFDRSLVGARVIDVSRRGKWLRLEVADGRSVFSHLGMTGRWVRRQADDPGERWERARIDVARRKGLVSARYLDMRRFGKLVVAEQPIAAWAELGPDPLVEGLDARLLRQRLGASRRPIKVALLDQTTVAGVGNIVATEALWGAKIDPRARADQLTPSQVSRLARALRAVIERSIRAQTGDEVEYVGDGSNDNPFRVYGHAGDPCPRCRAILVRDVLAGRATTFCPRCQSRGR